MVAHALAPGWLLGFSRLGPLTGTQEALGKEFCTWRSWRTATPHLEETVCFPVSLHLCFGDAASLTRLQKCS
ncbi:Hypothetical predicted protein [Podarcis lilfordi]|uniref:Uncharacterized protein n=1 Tax=Podarcis lilfordi TaxID=74358 RepID=A0AA35PF63_9SAUR|nr:Hypothetical predicted protein [Podarcis lilfordi]